MKIEKVKLSDNYKKEIKVQPLIFYSATSSIIDVPKYEEKIIERDNYCTCTLFQTTKYITRESRKLLISGFNFNKFSIILVLFLLGSCVNSNKFVKIDCELCTKFVDDKRKIFDIPYPTFKNVKDSLDVIGNQVAAFKLTAIGEQTLAQRYFDNHKTTSSVIKDMPIGKFNIYNPEQFIDSILQANKCIFFNEAHHRSDHRVFIEELIPVFVKNGVKRIGFEGFNSLDIEINSRKYPIIKSGYYTQDPAFGNLIRTALKYNIEIFGYEANSDYDSPGGREEQQADHIIKNTISKDSSKFIILGGFDHIREDTFLSKSWGGKAMASRFFIKSNIDPVTIDQYTLSDKKDLHPFYQSLAIHNATKLVNFNNIYSQKKFDYYLYHPKLENIRTKSTKSNSLIKLPQYLTNSYFGGLAIAYMYDEYKKEKTIDVLVPIEIISIKKEKNEFRQLPKGKYLIVIKNEIGCVSECLVLNN